MGYTISIAPRHALLLSDLASERNTTMEGVLEGVCARWLQEQQLMKNNAGAAPLLLSTASQGPIEPTFFSFYGTQGDVQFARRPDGYWTATLTMDPERHVGHPPLMVIKDDELIVRTDFEAMDAAALLAPLPDPPELETIG